MRTLIDFIQEAKSELDTLFNKYIKNNDGVKQDFILFVHNVFCGEKPMFKNLDELHDKWASVKEVENELYSILEEAADEDDFCHSAFYNLVDLLKGSDKKDTVDELAFAVLNDILSKK